MLYVFFKYGCWISMCVGMHFSWDKTHTHQVAQNNDARAQQCYGCVKVYFFGCFWFNMGWHKFGAIKLKVSSMDSVARLSAQLLQTTWEQCQLQVEGDLGKLADWAAKYQLFAGKQAINHFTMLPSWFSHQVLINKPFYLLLLLCRQRLTSNTWTTGIRKGETPFGPTWRRSWCSIAALPWCLLTPTLWKHRARWERMGFLVESMI